MKAIIPDQYKSCFEIDERSRSHSEQTMKDTWAEFHKEVSKNTFEYNDVDAALKITFLKQFDQWFHGIGIKEMSVKLSDYYKDKLSGRGSIIKPDEPIETPPYERLLPKEEYIKDDNRFSPPGVEWLYLSIGESFELIKECAEKECRVAASNRFAFCKFEYNHDYGDLKLVDLTIANEMTYDEINGMLQKAEKEEYRKRKRYACRYGYWTYRMNYNDDALQQVIAKWVLYVYAKMMSMNLFIPIETNDKKFEYLPFQTLAAYFIKEGYDGIVYSSTVCSGAKNIVLFNKNYALPYGDVFDYVIC